MNQKKLDDVLNKIDFDLSKLYPHKVKHEVVVQEEEDKKFTALLWVLAIIGVIAAVAGICYVLYRHFKPDYLDDFDEEFSDDYEESDIPDEEDDLYEDEE